MAVTERRDRSGQQQFFDEYVRHVVFQTLPEDRRRNNWGIIEFTAPDGTLRLAWGTSFSTALAHAQAVHSTEFWRALDDWIASTPNGAQRALEMLERAVGRRCH